MNLCNLSVIRDLMDRYGMAPKKGYGQNFLINQRIPEGIADESIARHRAGEGEPSCVLEIGPGIGCLTQELCRRYDVVRAVEIDKMLIPLLSETLAEYDNCRVYNEDFMKLDLPAFLGEAFPSARVSVCANLPYYITTPILMKLLEEGRKSLSGITVMVQSEVADRLTAEAGSADYGSITAVLRYYGTAKKLFTVAPGNFLPAPNVTSCVVHIALHEISPYDVADEKMLFRVIAGAFAQRRKTLLNSLSSSFSEIPKAEISAILSSLGYPEGIRGERLDTADFCRIANAFSARNGGKL